MQIEELQIRFSEHPEIKAIGERLKAKGEHLLLSGLYASARSLVLSQLRMPLFIVMDNAESAQYLFADLKTLETKVESQESSVFFFPHSQKRRAVDEAAQIQRTETLTELSVTGDGLRV